MRVVQFYKAVKQANPPNPVGRNLRLLKFHNDIRLSLVNKTKSKVYINGIGLLILCDIRNIFLDILLFRWLAKMVSCLFV